MTATQQFIEDAIKCGWKPVDEIMPKHFLWRTPFQVFVAGHLCSLYFETKVPNAEKESVLVRVSEILLDPLAWQAVGKTRGWSEPRMMKTVYEQQGIEIHATGCFAQQLYFNALLADGLTIEEALKALV